jgi:prepilin-type N-terminal cleavage/methylation domain-containing protein
MSRAIAHDAARGFTLLEMLVVVLFTGVVLTFAASFYIDLSRASQAALAESVDLRRATTVLDRIARDLESATLVKKPDALDPLEHSWLFLAEGRGSDGADRLRFQARNHRPRMGSAHESDLVEIAYWLAEAEDGEGFDLLRWSSARPPVPPLDRNFPRRDDPGVERLASRVASFAVRLQDEDGAWQSAWDSWSPAQSSQLPIAAEVQVALLPEDPVEGESLAQAEPERFVRPLVFALDPLDLEKALGAESSAEEDEEDDDLACVTVAECVSRNQAAVDGYLAQNPDLRGILASIADQCWKDHAREVPFPVSNCE